jgi:protein TIF31
LEKAEAVARLKSRPKSEGGAHVAADSTEVTTGDEQVKPEEAAASINNQVSIVC